MSAIELAGVSKSFGSRPAVSNISFAVETGERVVLSGPSGCGKTTVLRLIAGLVAADRGAVLINGRQVTVSGRVLVEPEHRQLGMVFQDLALWPHLTVRGNLDFVLEARRLPKPDRETRIAKMLKRVRLEEYANTIPAQLSGGQQQRVAIARALVAEPVAVLMDEPLSNLDDELKIELCDQLLDLHAQLGFTLIYVTHSQEETRRIGARIIRMRDGSVISGGPSQ